MLILKGFFIGSAAILPGVSGGVLAMSFGIYERLIDSILNFLKKPKENLKFLIPLALSIFLGIFLFSKVLANLFDNYQKITCICFALLILASLPSLIKEADLEFNLFNLLCFLLTFSASILLAAIKKQEIVLYNLSSPTFIQLLIIGIIMSSGIVIPRNKQICNFNNLRNLLIIFKRNIYFKFRITFSNFHRYYNWKFSILKNNKFLF